MRTLWLPARRSWMAIWTMALSRMSCSTSFMPPCPLSAVPPARAWFDNSGDIPVCCSWMLPVSVMFRV